MSTLSVRAAARPALHHAPTWLSPSLFWDRSQASYPAAPRLLRFDSDRFMEELAERLGAERPDLAALEVDATSDLESPGELPKLFQPAHGRFYLVTASLVCEAPGLPDRHVDPARGEQVGFVLRRAEAVAGGGTVESAWSRTGEGARPTWRAVPPGRERLVEDGEELFPMFPMSFLLGGRRRRLWAGLVPTSSRETFADAGAVAWTQGDPDPRTAEVETHVLLAYDQLRREGAAAPGGLGAEAAALLLRDLASYLARYHPALWTALAGPTAPAPTAAAALHRELQAAVAGEGSATWAAALHEALPSPGAGDGGTAPGPEVWRSPLTLETLEARLEALRAEEPLRAMPATEPAQLPKLSPGQRYVVRCVQVCPRCRPWKPAVVSAPSAPFLLAAFFDPDAPARPIRIALPADTSLKALRRFKKGVGVVLSAKLRAQLARVKGLKDDALDLADEQPGEGGQICMLSIPIITIAAVVLLMVIVTLLNLVFWWLPLFKICLPLQKGRS